MDIKNPRQSAKLFLSMMAVIGIITLIAFLRSPSEAGNQFLFGLSLTRLVIGTLFFLLLALNIVAILWVSLKPKSWRLSIESRSIAWLTNHLTLVIAALWIVALMTATILLFMIPPVIKMFHFLEPVRGRLAGLIFWLFFSSMLLNMFFRLTFREVLHRNKVIVALDRYLLLAVTFLIIFFFYEHILIWTGAANQTRYSYWNWLADEFLKGNLYLENPPQTHDLTLYKGNWYVPMPPLPAVLMMPLAYLFGSENIDTNDFSIALSSLNALLIFLILEQLARRRWITLSRVGILLLVVLFAFGNPHLWVGIRGRAWFLSQIVTVTFLALAIFGTLKSWSPWLVGISLGAAIAARPNGIMSWPFVLGIAMQIQKEELGTVSLRQILDWSIKSILPMGMAVAGLLIYNYARFENFLDFGYTSINGDPIIAANAQRYGIFSPHFILPNLKAMFFSIPTIQQGGQWPILPSATGMSIFLVTPPFIYLFHRYESKWWILGAWASVFLNFVLLVLYHNTGAHQFGYRYILDVIVPLIAMLSVALGKKIPWLFILLMLFSIAFNLYGTYWFING